MTIALRPAASHDTTSFASCTESAVVCVGVSHLTAPLALRERLHLDSDSVAALLSRFADGRMAGEPRGNGELVVLSTCNRLELYAMGAMHVGTVEALIMQATGVSADELRPVLYRHHGAEAVRHLCRVAAGLDSLVLGEPQVLGQVAAAHSIALANGTAAHGLGTLFTSAVRAGRRARNETDIGRHATTVSAIAARAAAELLPDLATACVLVLGTGEMAQLAVDALWDRGVRNFHVVSRTLQHAEQLASRVGGATAPLAQLPQILAEADIAICAAATPRPLLTLSMVALAMSLRPARPMVVLDVGMPRNVDPLAGRIPGVRCFDLEHLRDDAEHGAARRRAQMPHVEAIVAAEAARCVTELRRLEVQPVIADWRAQVDGVRERLLHKSLVRLTHLNTEDIAQIEALSESLVNQLLHVPMHRLRVSAEQGQSAGYTIAIRHLFALDA
ncbi:glutamyl-tRNA reductase [soil metagenome]